jgi:pimeloyl-ACP methyl ester carboxylesterase
MLLQQFTSPGAFRGLDAGGGEPHGCEEFIATVDALVMGRNTFETVLAFDAWPYGTKLVELEGLGHMGPVAHPDVVNPVIAQFLARA